MDKEHLFIRACKKQVVERPPIWMMRQAGRYLPQYRAVRAKHSFLEVCKTPELACEVTMQPIDEFGFDAAILFCDILIPLEKMGLELSFPKGGPKIANPVRSQSDVDKLVLPDPNDTMPYVMEAIRVIRKALDNKIPLIGFAGAPFTMMTYAVEGGGSKSFPETKRLLFGDPKAAHDLMDKLSESCASYLLAQIEAGAEAVQLFDSWAGILGPQEFREFALRHADMVIDKIRDSKTWQNNQVPIIYFVNGSAPYLGDYKKSKADVLGVDWRMELDVAREALGWDRAVQGNMDPTLLFASQETIAAKVKDICSRASKSPGHIFNLGHGVLPPTNPEHVRTMVDTVKALAK